MELKRLEERYVLLVEDTPSDCWASCGSVNSHRTSRWLLLYLFFSSALGLLQVFAQHVYNCVLHTEIANSSRGKPPPNWQRRPTKMLLFLQVAELSQAGRDSMKGWTSEPVWQLLRLNRWEITFQGRGALKSQRDSSSPTIYIQIEPFLLLAWLVINKVKGFAGCLPCLSPIGSTGNAKQEIVLADRHLSNISNTLQHFFYSRINSNFHCCHSTLCSFSHDLFVNFMSQSKMCFYSYIFEQQVVLQKKNKTDTVTKMNIF